MSTSLQEEALCFLSACLSVRLYVQTPLLMSQLSKQQPCMRETLEREAPGSSSSSFFSSLIVLCFLVSPLTLPPTHAA